MHKINNYRALYNESNNIFDLKDIEYRIYKDRLFDKYTRTTFSKSLADLKIEIQLKIKYIAAEQGRLALEAIENKYHWD